MSATGVYLPAPPPVSLPRHLTWLQCLIGTGPRLAQAYLTRLMASVTTENGSSGAGSDGGAGAGAAPAAATSELFAKIAEMDPHHARFYKYASHARSPMLGDLSAPAPAPRAEASQTGGEIQSE